MPDIETVATLFELAIVAEQRAKEFFLGLAEKFSDLPEVSHFWRGMGLDEVRHAQGLEDIRDCLSSSQLLLPADPSVLRKAKEVLTFSVSDALKSVETLDDAYLLARNLERSEVNTVFAFITNEFISSETQKEFILRQLEDHTEKIMKFPQTFGNAERRSRIAASSP